MKNNLVLFIVLFACFTLYASDVKFYNINSLYGISIRETSTICKDENGFIWTASRAGILRVTESDHRIYQLPYTGTGIISVKLTQNKSNLFAYTNNGQLFLYDKIYDRFNLVIDFREPLDRYFLYVHRIVVDDDDIAWVGTSDALYKYSENKIEVVSTPVEARFLIPYKEQSLLVGTADGLLEVNKNTQEIKELYNHRGQNRLYISTLFFDKKRERVWVGTFSEGVHVFDLSENKFSKLPIHNFPRQPILAFEENSGSTLLVGIDGKGIWEINKEGNSVLNIYKEDVDNPSSLEGDGVYDIFCDENRRVWVSTYSGGLSFFDQESPVVSHITHQINNPNSLSNNNINKIQEDSRGHIWFATNNGINRWNIALHKWDTYYRNEPDEAKVFLALCEDDDGNIWAGTYSSGIYVLDGKTGKELMHYSADNPESGFPHKFILDIYKDSQGDIWIGGIRSNIHCYLKKEKRFRAYSPEHVNGFIELSPGKLLLICSYGLLSLDKESGDHSILWTESLINDLLIEDDHLWLATSGDGLIKYYPETNDTIKFTTQSGLASNFVKSIIRNKNRLIAGTENGLCEFDPETHQIQIYTTISPLSNISYNTKARYRLANNKLIWGTNKGAIMFDPDSLLQNEMKARIYFQDMHISGSSIRENDNLLNNIPVNQLTNLTLPYHQNNFVLELISIGAYSTGTRYSWKLEGIDTDWNQPSGQQFITYTNLPGGNYKLKIRMHDRAQSRVIDERSLNVKIIPPFWATWWFRLIMILIFSCIIIYALRIYSNRLKQKHAKDKIRFFTNMAHDIRTSLTLISAPVEQLNNAPDLPDHLRYYSTLASEQSGRLSAVATQLLDFEKVDSGKGQLFLVMTDIVKLASNRSRMFETFAATKGIRLLFSSNMESYITAVDVLKIEKVIDNLISNAIKYSHPESHVEIIVTCDAGTWAVTVKDYGLGISERAQKKLFKEFYRGDNVVNSGIVGSGIGLLLVKNYVQMHTGYISFDSKEKVGSSFKIVIPYKEADNFVTHNGPDEKTEIIWNIALDKPLHQTEEKETSDKKMHLLIVEDNTDLLNFLTHVLRQHYKISKANNGVEAWELIREKAPDLIISDIMMPEMDGFELCKMIKSTFETSHIPLILLTSLSQKTKHLEGLGLGADDYITKPFDVTILSQRISSILKNREILRERAIKLIKQPDDNESVFTNELNDQFIKKAIETVHKNISNQAFGKEDFASAMHVSSSLLYQKIKALTGQSPIDFIRTIRFNHAIKLLQTKKYTITEVSEMCGFSSPNYFSTSFKKYFGKSPNEI